MQSIEQEIENRLKLQDKLYVITRQLSVYAVTWNFGGSEIYEHLKLDHLFELQDK